MQPIKASNITEQLAPVSGLRCRDCGAGTWRSPDAEWFIQHSAAYCPECAFDAFADAYLHNLRCLDTCDDAKRAAEFHSTLERMTNEQRNG